MVAWTYPVQVIYLLVIFHITDGMWYLGWPAVWRESADSVRKAVLLINPSTKAEKDGYVTGWHVYASRSRRTQVVHLQVWRPADTSSIIRKTTRYRLVGETIFIAHWVGHSYVPLYPEDRIHIQQNDTIGIYFHKFNPIPWSSVACGVSNRHLFKYNPRVMDLDIELSFETAKSDWKPCRLYSVNATVETLEELANFDIYSMNIPNIRGYHGRNLPTRHPLLNCGAVEHVTQFLVIISFVLCFVLLNR